MPFNNSLSQYDSKRGEAELIKTLDCWLKVPGFLGGGVRAEKIIVRRPEKRFGMQIGSGY